MGRLSQVREGVRNIQDKQGRTAADAKFTGEKPSAFLYLGVSMIALLKDLLDFVGVGSLPAIGTVVTICFTFLIWMLLSLFDKSSQNTRSNMHLMRGLVVIGFGLVEAIGFGLNFLPIETTMVIVLYQMAKHAWKEEEKKAKKEGRPSVAQLRRDRSVEARQARAEERAAQREAAASQMQGTTQQQSMSGGGAAASPMAMLSSPSLHAQPPMPMTVGQGLAPSQPQRTMSDMNTPPASLSDEKYQQFSDTEKMSWAAAGLNPLIEAEHAKRSTEVSLAGEQHSVEQYREKVENLRSDIEEKKSRILPRILEFRQIRGLEKELRGAERSLSSGEQMVQSRAELLSAYDHILTEQEELGALMEEANKENAQWDERKRGEYLEEEKKRDIGNLSRTHKTYFIHDIIDAEWKPSANNRAIDTKSLDWENQLDILTGLNPTISVSTLDQGSSQRTFGQGAWGAFISGGRAIGGGRSDIGSVAVGLRDRRVFGRDGSLEAIEEAVAGRDVNESYNELIVEQPEVAGVYFKLTDTMPPLSEEMSFQNGNGVRYDSWWKQMENVMNRNVPMFVLTQDNKAHLLYDIDTKKRTFKVAAEMSPEDIVSMPGIYKQHLGKDEKKAAVGRVFDNVSHLLADDEKSVFAPDGAENNPIVSSPPIHR